MSDGTEVDVTAQASWSCGNSLIASISATGKLRSLRFGTCDVTAVYLGVSAKLKVAVSLV